MSHTKSILKFLDTDYELVPVSRRGNKTSELRKYDDDHMKNIPVYQYKALEGSSKKIRLLQLKPGAKDSPDIVCELMEANYDNDFHIPMMPSGDGSSDNSLQKPDDEDYTALQKKYPNIGGMNEIDEELKQKLQQYEKLRKDEIKYEALSWCWGKDVAEYAILITERTSRNRETTYKLNVRRELALALKNLRYANRGRTLWIDAICIDQNNSSERNHQVQMMSRIYTRSAEVCIWLGDSDDSSHRAIEFIRKEIVELRNFDALSKGNQYTDKWQALMMLMQREWFSRRWVVQEIALANKATIHCGADSIRWKEFAVAVELFVEVETATHRLSEIMQKDEKFRHVPGWFEYVSELGASLLVQATGKVFRAQRSPLEENDDSTHDLGDGDKDKPLEDLGDVTDLSKLQDNDIRDANDIRDRLTRFQTIDPLDRRSLLSLEYLVSSMFIFQASEPRDTIYAMLAISRDAAPFASSSETIQDHHDNRTRLIMTACEPFLEEKPFIVDYRRPYADVCKDFVHFAIQRKASLDATQALDILLRPWALEPREGGRSLPARLKSARAWDPLKKPPRKHKPLPWNGGRKKDERTTDKYWEDAARKEPLRWHDERESKDKKLNWERKKRRYFPDRPIPDGKDTSDTPENSTEFTGRTTQNVGDTNHDAEDPKDEQQLGLPSWVSRASQAPFSIDFSPGIEIQKTARANADPLVGHPQDGHRNYMAAQTQKLRPFQFRRRPQLGHYSLYVQGFELDEIAEVRDASQGGCIPKSWIELANWDDYKTKDPPGEFWRTLVADRGNDNKNPPYYYAKACRESVNKGGIASGRVDTAALINNERNSIVAEFCRRVHAVIWNRRLFRTKGGRLGLAGDKIKEGDKICILYGCTVPVILNEHKKDPVSRKKEREEDRVESLKRVIRKLVRSFELYDKHERKKSKGEAQAVEIRKQKAQLKPKDFDKYKIKEEVLTPEDLEKHRKYLKKAVDRLHVLSHEDGRHIGRKFNKIEDLMNDTEDSDKEDNMPPRKKNDERRATCARCLNCSHNQMPTDESKEEAGIGPSLEAPAAGSGGGVLLGDSGHTTGDVPDDNWLLSEIHGHPCPSAEPEDIGEVFERAFRLDNSSSEGLGPFQRSGPGSSDRRNQGPKKPRARAMTMMEKKKAAAEETAPGVWYEFKGECYLHGMMDGEAIRERIYQDILDEQVFELR